MADEKDVQNGDKTVDVVGEVQIPKWRLLSLYIRYYLTPHLVLILIRLTYFQKYMSWTVSVIP